MPKDELSVPERSVLLALMAIGTEASNNDVEERFAFKIEVKERESLRDQNLIEFRKGSRGAFFHKLTSEGWSRCAEELASGIPKGVPKASRIVYGVLGGLTGHYSWSGAELRSIFKPEKGLEQRIRNAYKKLRVGPGEYVKLARLRDDLHGVTQPELDEALLKIDLEPGVYLIAETNQKVLTEVDRKAAIWIGGENKHLILIEHP